MATTLDLDACYAACRELTRRHGSTYYFCARFFPPAVRRSIFGLYGFVRVPDELVDNPEPGADAPAQQRRALLGWREELDRSVRRGSSSDPVMNAFVDTMRRHDLPLDYPHAFLDSMLMDVDIGRYETFADLLRYTHGSASVIGLMICTIVGVTDPAAFPFAADLGLAMQLTNFLRDIAEDYRDRGRIYLPLADLRRFGYGEADLAAGRVDGRFRSLMRFEIEHNRTIYTRVEPGIAYLPPFARFPVRLAGCLYAAILERIEAQEYDVFSTRAATSTAFKLRTAAAHWAAARVNRAPPLVTNKP